MIRHEFGIIFWIHLAIIVALALSPFLFDVWIIVAGMLVFWLQLLVFGDCVLTRLQFGPRGKRASDSFFFHYLRKLRPAADPIKVSRFVGLTQPLLVLAVGVIWQWLFGFHPLIV